jgi:hypothetical protein
LFFLSFSYIFSTISQMDWKFIDNPIFLKKAIRYLLIGTCAFVLFSTSQVGVLGDTWQKAAEIVLADNPIDIPEAPPPPPEEEEAPPEEEAPEEEFSPPEETTVAPPPVQQTTITESPNVHIAYPVPNYPGFIPPPPVPAPVTVPIVQPAQPQPQPIFVPSQPTTTTVVTPSQPQPIFIPSQPQPQPIFIPNQPQPQTVFIPQQQQQQQQQQQPVSSPAPVNVTTGDVTQTANPVISNKNIVSNQTGSTTITSSPTNTNTVTVPASTNTNTITKFIHEIVRGEAPAQVQVQKQPVIVAGVQTAQPASTTQIQELPKTGIPLLGWAAAAFLPAGFGLKRFNRGLKESNQTGPHYTWDKRRFKLHA